MTTHKILLLAGDGIGPEVMAEVERLVAFFNGQAPTALFETKSELVGGSAIDAIGMSVSDSTAMSLRYM